MRKSELIKYLEQIPGDPIVISEESEIGYFYVGKPSLVRATKYMVSDLKIYGENPPLVSLGEELIII